MTARVNSNTSTTKNNVTILDLTKTICTAATLAKSIENNNKLST